MDLFPLVLIFILAGLVAIIYYKISPDKENLKERLPNKPTLTGIFLWFLVGLALYFIFKNQQGFQRTVTIFTFIFSLLVFETFFLFLIKYLKSNSLAVVISALITILLFTFHFISPSFALRNIIIILATLGASTLLVRLNYLKNWLMFAFAFVWTGYDIYATRFFLPKVLVPVEEPPKFFFLPSVISGSVSLGSGDFIFLVLFLMVIMREFGLLPAIILLAAETVGLLITGFFLTAESIIPFLGVMTPIFIIIYLVALVNKKSKIYRPVK